MTAARIAAHWLSCHRPGEAFVVSTAPTEPQVRAILWREIGRAHSRGKLLGRVTQKEWYMRVGDVEELVAFGRKPSDYNPDAFQGIHAPAVLVIIDEACGVDEAETGGLWTAATSLTTSPRSRILAIGNPDDPTSRFAKVCAPDSGWHVIRIDIFDTPNFTGEYVPPEVADVLVGPLWLQELAQDLGVDGEDPDKVDNPIYVSKARGRFPEDSADGVVPLSWVRKCQGVPGDVDAQDIEGMYPVELGCDIAASEGGDATVIRERRGARAHRVWRVRSGDPARVEGEIVTAMQASRPSRVKIDVIGVGWGVAGRIEELIRQGETFDFECEVVRVNVGEGSTDPARFPKLRDQVWWEIARKLTQDGAWDLTELDERTVADLIAPKWKPDSAGRTNVEPKKETKKRLKRSPDDADALILAFYSPPEAAGGGAVW